MISTRRTAVRVARHDLLTAGIPVWYRLAGQVGLQAVEVSVGADAESAGITHAEAPMAVSQQSAVAVGDEFLAHDPGAQPSSVGAQQS